MIQEFFNQTDFDMYFKYIGVIGFLLYMTSFAALQIELINSDGLIYTIVSICAALMVLVSLSVDWNLSSALIQVAWIIIGSIGLCKRWRKKTVELAQQRASNRILTAQTVNK